MVFFKNSVAKVWRPAFKERAFPISASAEMSFNKRFIVASEGILVNKWPDFRVPTIFRSKVLAGSFNGTIIGSGFRFRSFIR